jgi:cellulose biosynthesis protein BcsQ
MADAERNQAARKGDKGLAKDVAHLYSWAKVSDPSYRTFVRTKPQPPPLTEVADEEKASAHSTALREKTKAKHRRGAPSSKVAETAKVNTRAPESGEIKVRSALAVASVAGGVGKTTICANLARTLCSMGERVLLVDGSGSGLLPFYFGATDLRFGLRTFVAQANPLPMMQVISAQDITVEWLQTAVADASLKAQRVIFDVGFASAHVLPRILEQCDVLLVPLLSDLNSLLTVQRIEERVLAGRRRGLRVPSPFYLFNKFDERSPMEREAHGLAIQHCSDRLLPFTIRRSASVAEAICDRMTVVDSAPQSEVARDCEELARWVRTVAPVAENTIGPVQWSER